MKRSSYKAIFTLAGAVAFAAAFAASVPASAQGVTANIAADVAFEDVQVCFLDAANGEVAPECVGDAAALCMEQPEGQTTAGMGACLMAETGHWDALLNQSYQEAMDRLAPEVQTALRGAQRAWISYRDAQCDLAAAMFNGGTMRSVAYAGCKMSETAERAIELRDIGVTE